MSSKAMLITVIVAVAVIGGIMMYNKNKGGETVEPAAVETAVDSAASPETEGASTENATTEETVPSEETATEPATDDKLPEEVRETPSELTPEEAAN